ncbi:MAG: hypothetical protein AABN33_17150 [Acidobacteriota bacterium]
MAKAEYRHIPKSEDIIDAFQKNLGLTGTGGFLLGFVSAVLVSKTVSIPRTVTGVFLWSLVIVIVLWFFGMMLKREKFGQSRWGPLSLLVLGYGLGALIYEYRAWAAWIWERLVTIDSTPKLLLAALFLFGVIMGFFIVRNWSKAQEDFTKSVFTIAAGALITPLLARTTDKVDTFQAFVFYFFGFAVSGSMNLLAAALLTANYSNKQTIVSRSMLSFLYGSDKAEAVDRQFLKNFEDDPVYARRLLINAVLQFKKKVLREFARKREEKRKNQVSENFRYYQLLSIKCDEEPESQDDKAEPRDQKDDSQVKKLYTTIFREITEKTPINEEMFRIAVSLKFEDNLEYIGAPGAYRKPFSYYSSVAGLALFVRQTIVMDRDKYKRYRNSDFPEGLCPNDKEMSRGLDEIDFLSYIAVPVASSVGQHEETPLGVLHVDTRLFAAPPEDFAASIVDSEQGIYTAKLSRENLTDYANNLYDNDDAGVRYLEEMRAVLVPVLQLYLKCRQGST